MTSKTLQSKERQQKLRGISYLAAALLTTTLTLNVQAAGYGLVDTLDVFNHQRQRAAIHATHQARIVFLEARLAARVDGELSYGVKRGVENLSYPIRLDANAAAYTMRTSARDVLRAIENTIRRLRLN